MSESDVLKILIIDDNQDDLEFYMELLKECDRKYQVFTAADGKTGVELFKEHNVDCTFLDYNLPETDGLKVLEVLQKNAVGLHLPVIMLTGEPHQKVQAEAARKGALDYVAKGARVTPGQLDELIEKAIQWAKQLNAERAAV